MDVVLLQGYGYVGITEVNFICYIGLNSVILGENVQTFKIVLQDEDQLKLSEGLLVRNFGRTNYCGIGERI